MRIIERPDYLNRLKSLKDTPTDLMKVMEYMMDNTSNICSPNGIASSLTSGGKPTCNKTVESYLEYLSAVA